MVVGHCGEINVGKIYEQQIAKKPAFLRLVGETIYFIKTSGEKNLKF